MKRAIISKEEKLRAIVTYDKKRIITIGGSERDKMKEIFSQTYDIPSGFQENEILVSTLEKMKPADTGYVDAVLLNIVQLMLGYDIQVQELKG